MEVLVTGGDTDLGRTVAEGFRDDGHKVTLVGARRDDLEVVAKELDADAIACDITNPASLAEVRGLFPHHLDTIVNVPAPTWDAGDPRTYSLADTATAWRNALDTTVLSAVLTVQTGHHRALGGVDRVLCRRPSVIWRFDHQRGGGEPTSGQRRRGDQGCPVELGRRASRDLGTAASRSTPWLADAVCRRVMKGCRARRLRWPRRSPGWRCFSPPRRLGTSPARRFM
ncbi:short chain dehydrogenase [Mycobacterium shottsii]|nr:short chain dehydrogenase [Mycobacterium shottsii]